MIIESNSIDLRERGRAKDGSTLYSSRRLYMQFLAFGNVKNMESLAVAIAGTGISAVLYSDLNDPKGMGLLWMHEDPSFFVGQGRDLLNAEPFDQLEFKPDFTMTGRSYAVGYESDLDEVLIHKPKRRVLDPVLAWAIWYPVRRTKDFESLTEEKKHEVMMDHGGIGRLFGKAEFAHDIRLSCHGLDRNDNDFVIGVLSSDLSNASLVVQAMRKSQQTMHYIDNLGPFFVGKVYRQFPEGQ